MSQTIDATADPFSNRLAGRRLGRYEVLARLAGGGMASVYVARALGVAGFERLFAVKVLHPHLAHEEEFITMFLDEARLAARIRHPNVVATIDISDTQDAGYYLVMDYIEGDHLGALLQHAFKRGERLPAPDALRIVVDALDGLAAAHSLTDETGRTLNLVHRDISPHNIMVSTDGIARITDFGVAKAEFRLSTTREGQFKGKLAYMAPEHASNGESDQRSDLFAMAIILWEALAGRRLFRAENHAATLNKICLEPIPTLSETDPALAPFDAILQKGLARDPAQRFQTAHEFAEAIEKQAYTLGGLATPRHVAKLVKEFAAEKIVRDKQCIREAMAELSLAQEAMRPEESGPHRREASPLGRDAGGTGDSRSKAQLAPPAPAGHQPKDVHATEGLADSLEPELGVQAPELARSKRSLWVAAVLLGLAGGVAVATLLWGSLDARDEVSVSTRIDAKETVAHSAATNAIRTPPPSGEIDAEPSLPGTDSEAAGVEVTSDEARARAERADATPSAAATEGGGTLPRARSPRRQAEKPAATAPTVPSAPIAPAPADLAPTKPAPVKPKPPEDDLLLNPYR